MTKIKQQYQWRVTGDNGIFDSKDDAQFQLRKHQRYAKKHGLVFKMRMRVYRQKIK